MPAEVATHFLGHEGPKSALAALRRAGLATELTAGAQYDIYRWDSVAAALTYDAQYKKATFAAVGTTYVYADDKSFQSNSTTYYRVVRAE